MSIIKNDHSAAIFSNDWVNAGDIVNSNTYSAPTGVISTNFYDLSLNAGYRLYLNALGGGWGTPMTFSTNTPMTHHENTTAFLFNSTYAPTAAKTISGATHSTVYINSTINQTGAADQDYTVLKVDLTEAAATGTNKQLMCLSTNSVDKFVVTSNGNIGVGSSAPGAKLDVVGKTKTSTLQVTTGAASGLVLQSDASGNATWASVGTPTGIVNSYAGSSAPTGWLICDGAAVNRTTYADLFAVIGTTYGAGNGSTTFNLPDMRGRVAVGVGTGTYKSAGILHSNGGNLTARTLGEYNGAEYPSGIPISYTSPNTDEPGYLTTTGSDFYRTSPTATGPGNSEGGNMQPYVGL